MWVCTGMGMAVYLGWGLQKVQCGHVRYVDVCEWVGKGTSVHIKNRDAACC